MDRVFLRAKLRRAGLWRALLYYAVRGLRPLGQPEVYRLLRLTPEESRLKAVQVAGLECANLGPDRLRCAAEDPGSGLSPAEVAGALGRGELCYGAFVGPVLASHAWYPRGEAHLRGGLSVSVGPAWSYCRWSFTRPDFRGLGLHAAVKAYALSDVVRTGRRGILSLVASTNLESLHGNLRAGCRPVGRLFIVRAAGRQIAWRSPGCRSHGLSVAAAPVSGRERHREAVLIGDGREGR